jgi:hypothetical protein
MRKITVTHLRSRRPPATATFDRAADAWDFVDRVLVRECLSPRCVVQLQEGHQLVINAIGRRLLPRKRAGLA